MPSTLDMNRRVVRMGDLSTLLLELERQSKELRGEISSRKIVDIRRARSLQESWKAVASELLEFVS